MKKVINTLLDKLAEQAGEVATCKVALGTAAEESKQYYTWWQDEVTLTKKLKATVAELEVRVFDLTGSIEAAGLTVEEKPNEVSG